MKKNKKRHRKLKVFLSVISLAIVGVVAYVLITGWVNGLPKLNYHYNTVTASAVAYPDVEFAVISDLHVYSPTLGTTGSAFEEVLHSDRKLLLDSTDLLDYAIADILKSNAQFVLISGDLTKDGELVCHELVTEHLSQLTDAGLAVYVVPGNHDVNNPDAASYSGDETTTVDTISPDTFAQLYADFGYSDAILHDLYSLSYVAEPVEDLWVLAIDSCRYRENQAGVNEIVGGKVSQETADWIAGVLSQAASEGKAVITLMHHGVVEHWDGQHSLHPDYLIEDYQHFGNFLASYDVRLVFTGHYHAQDITQATFDDKFIYDIETGSLVTAPCPIRYCTIKNNSFSVNSELIVDKLHPGTAFADDALAFVKTTVVLEAVKTLNKYLVSGTDADIISNAVGDAFSAHYSGDEITADRPPLESDKLSPWGRVVLFLQQYVLDGLWVDKYPADNKVSFSLA